MILKILNKNNFTNKFLHPISRINDLCTLVVEKDKIYNINRTADGNFSLYSVCDEIAVEDYKDKTNLSFSEIKKFIKVFDCIPENAIDLIIHSNFVEYKSGGTRFKFHLINDNIVRAPNYSIEKINSLTYNNEFNISLSAINTLIKSSTFITSSNKIYLTTDEGNVYAELDDKAKTNIDTFSTKISDHYKGSALNNPLGFNFDILRNISALKCPEILVRVNTDVGYVAFEIGDDNYKLKYTSAAYSI
jgi:hypothetical protein